MEEIEYTICLKLAQILKMQLGAFRQMGSCLHYALYEIPEAPACLSPNISTKTNVKTNTLNRKATPNSSVLSQLSDVKSLSINDQNI